MIAGMYSNPNSPNQSNAYNTFCENIAIYNAMEYYNPGAHASLSQIVYDNTTNNNLMQSDLFGYSAGGLGTNPYTIPETMENYGYNTTEYNIEAADAITPDMQEVVIISSFNNEDNKFDGIHTYCLTAGEDSNGNACYYSHNEYGDPPVGGPYYSVGDYVEHLGDFEKHKEVIEIIGVDEP